MLKSLVLLLWFMLHPVHVTMTSIDYVPESDSLKVFVKMYFDDFLLDLGQGGESRTADFFSSKDQASLNVVENYLNRKLLIRVNKRLLPGKLDKLEIVDNEVRLNIGYNISKQPDVITVRNLIMTELFSDQSNLMIVKVNNFEEGIKLTAEITETTFKIK
jgi:hypothetical protein